MFDTRINDLAQLIVLFNIRDMNDTFLEVWFHAYDDLVGGIWIAMLDECRPGGLLVKIDGAQMLIIDLKVLVVAID